LPGTNTLAYCENPDKKVLKHFDQEADIYGIDFVKNDDPHAARHFHIYNTPALVKRTFIPNPNLVPNLSQLQYRFLGLC
jgi:hypothetical protein